MSSFVTGNAIENMGSASPRPVEGTLLPPPRPSPHIQHDELNVNLFEDLNSVGNDNDTANKTTEHTTQQTIKHLDKLHNKLQNYITQQSIKLCF